MGNLKASNKSVLNQTKFPQLNRDSLFQKTLKFKEIKDLHINQITKCKVHCK